MNAQPRKQQLSPATLLILDFAETRGILDKKENGEAEKNVKCS